MQVVGLGDLGPKRLLVRHHIGQLDGLDRADLHVEELGDLRPKQGPSGVVPIGDVEGFVCRAWFRGGPEHGFRYDFDVGDLIDRVE
jgi:hypothetical protein